MIKRALAVGWVLSLTGSCVPTVAVRTAFSSRFADNNRAQVTAVFQRLPATRAADRASNALGVPVIAGIAGTGATRAVVLYDAAANRRLWSTPLAASSTPYIIGDAIAVGTGNAVTALDIRTGRQRWSVDSHAMNFMGAARDGDMIALVFSLGASGNGTRVGRVVGVQAASGDVVWSQQLVGILGRPAASAGYAFIPWDRQSIAALDIQTGVERARLRTTDDVLAWVFSSPQGVFYGSRGAYRWTPQSASGTRSESAYLANPLDNIPGDPPLFRDGFTASTGTRTARDKIRFAFRPRDAEGNRMAVEGDTLYLAYYRFLVAVNVTTGDVRWARAFGPDDNDAVAAVPAAAASSTRPSGTPDTASALEAMRRAQASFSQYDIESLTVLPNALVAVAGNGKVRAIDPNTGAVLGTQDLGGDLAAISTDLAGYRPPTTGAEPAPDGTPRDQLVNLIRDTDNRLVPIRGYLVQLLAHRPEQEVTRELLDLYRQRSIPPALRQEIATALRARRNGAQFLVQALEGEASHYNFLENRQAPPLDVIAPTLAAMGAREAVPVLLQHMLDHETPMASLPAVINAIATLGDASAIPQLQAFVQRYKSDSAFSGEKSVPLQTAAAGIFRLGDANARQWLTALSHEASAHAPLRTSITRLFEDERAGSQQRTVDEQVAQARERLQGRINALQAMVNEYPRTISPDVFSSEWDNHLDDLRGCAQSVLTRLPNLNQIRIDVTLRSESPEGLFDTTPPAPRLPANSTGAQRIAAIDEQLAWVERHIETLQGHQSVVRTLAYSPQDAQMAQCMNQVLRPVHFAGFGRGISTRTFQQSISTVRSHATANGTPGFGMPQGSSILVPWFLVSSPSLNVATGQLVSAPTDSVATPPTTGPTAVSARPTAANPHHATPLTAPTTTNPASASPPPTTAPANAHPWWEEQ